MRFVAFISVVLTTACPDEVGVPNAHSIPASPAAPIVEPVVEALPPAVDAATASQLVREFATTFASDQATGCNKVNINKLVTATELDPTQAKPYYYLAICFKYLKAPDDVVCSAIKEFAKRAQNPKQVEALKGPLVCW
jgi:hypothetical protein